jgi:hypothetical protein
MELLGTFEQAKQKVLADVQRFVATIRELAALPFTTCEAGVGILDRVRRETYEDLNQIQHEHLILCAAEWLLAQAICEPSTQWSWNPRQTGNHQEPDLRGMDGNTIVVSAEITTSERPVGVIDTRMHKTLRKLAAMEGSKFYFVRTQAMERRARTKVEKAGWEIRVVRLAVDGHPRQTLAQADAQQAAPVAQH